MSGITLCRGCLSSGTESKLVDMRQHGLIAIYDQLTQNTRSVCDHLPPYVCSYCMALLLKCAAFRDKCVRARRFLENMLLSDIQATTDYINTIDRVSNKLILPLTIDRSIYTIDCTHANIDLKETRDIVKQENEKEDYNFIEIDSDSSALTKTQEDDAVVVVIGDITEVKKKIEIESKKRKVIEKENKTFEDNIEKKCESKKHFGDKKNKTKGRNLTRVINRKDRIEKSDDEAEIRQIIKELCSDSDIDDILNDISHDKEISKKNSKKEKKSNGEETDSTSSDEQTDIEQILKEVCSDNELDAVIKFIHDYEAEQGVIKRDKERVKKKGKECKPVLDDASVKKEREYKPVLDDVTFSKQCNVNIIILSEEEQKAEIEARKDSMSYKDSLYKCDMCYKGWQTKETLSHHMEKHDQKNGRLCCEICSYRFKSADRLRSHRLSHRYKLVCRLCGFESRTRYHARRHHKRHKGHTFRCEYCGAEHPSQSGHLSHIRLRHPSELDACPRCGEAFIGPRGLEAHRKLTAGRCRPPSDGHHTGGRGARQHCCSMCGERFASARAARTHARRVHLRLQPRPPAAPRAPRHVCEICGRKYHALSLLKYHLMTHDGVLPFPCPQCPKAFTTSLMLRIHARAHSGERPFRCAQCGRAFSTQSNYIRHKNMHTGVKRYKCDICDKMFTQSNSVKVHIKTVHMKQPGPPRKRNRVAKKAVGAGSGEEDSR